MRIILALPSVSDKVHSGLPGDQWITLPELFKLANYTTLIARDGQLHLNLEDQVVRETLVAHRGHVVNARLRELLHLEPLKTQPEGSPPVSHLAGK